MTGPAVDVEELERLLEAAKPEAQLPWSVLSERVYSADDYSIADTNAHDDAALIAAAVNALPALLDLIRRQDAALTAVRELHQPWHWGKDGNAVVGSVDPDPDSDGYTRCICGTGGGFWPCPTAAALASHDTAQEA